MRREVDPLGTESATSTPAPAYQSLEVDRDGHPRAWAAVEALSAAFHFVYQTEAARQSRQSADTMRHPDDYAQLPEHTKDYDRALALYVLDLYERAMTRGHQNFLDFLDAEAPMLTQALDAVQK